MARDLSELTTALEAKSHAVFGAWCPGTSTADLAASLGTIEAIAGIHTVQALTPKAREASTSNVYSGNFGHDAFPLHTDFAHWSLPPRYLLLRCIRPDAGTFTSFVDWRSALGRLSTDDVARARFRPRKPVDGRVHFLPFRQQVGDAVLYRWDSLFLVPDNLAARNVAAALREIEPSCQMPWRQPGDTLVLDNWRTMHGRSAVAPGSERMLERVYLREIDTNG